MKYRRLFLAFMMGTTIAAMADNEAQTVSIMTLNVDGLPRKVLFFDVNADGPGSAGSEVVSEYIASKNCDIVAMQEDFNYHWEIWSRLFAGYNHDEWSGGIMMEDEPIDYAHLHNHRFKADGLNMVWKKDCQSTAYERVPWQQSFGKFSHEFDDIITKGFRRHELTLANGTEIVVYNMHMDASSERDESVGNDTKDREARLSQWQQLCQHILARLDNRPIIVAGDMNSYYNRDDIQTAFFEPLTASGKATVGDAWMVLHNEGQYPALGGDKLKSEELDKVLYVNPTVGNILIPVSAELDTDGYMLDGKPLGDHTPLIVTFQFSRTDKTGISTVQQTRDAEVYSLSGIRQQQPSRGVNIVNGKKVAHP